MKELQTWLRWVDKWAKGDGTRELQIVLREENCERREYYRQSFAYGPFTHYVGRQEQSYWQHYTGPSADPLPATNTALSNTLLPLRSGCLTHNSAGVPIIVACAKVGHDITADAPSMGGMVKGKGGTWEERTDGIMQVLRTNVSEVSVNLITA